MNKYILYLVIALLTDNVAAQVFKCKGPDGKVQFSDKACQAGNSAEVVPDRAPVSQQQRDEARQRAQQMKDESATLDGQKAAVNAAYQAEQQRRDDEKAKQAAEAKTVANDSDAAAKCVRDVERRGPSEGVKAEMIAACRTAGLSQRSMGMTGDAVSTCVKNVERTGASEKEKARQIAACHGGDVQPEPPPPPKPKPTAITTCDGGGCWDNVGNRYNRVGGSLFRSDGKVCQILGNSLQCN